jgi:hypothetical protein
MNGKERLKKVIQYAKDNNLIKSQKELGMRLGYTSETTFSQIVAKDSDKWPKNLVKKIKVLFPNINADWLLTGEGVMLKSDIPSVEIGDDSPSFNVKSRIEQPKTLDKALDALRVSQGQIDRLITIIENMQK